MYLSCHDVIYVRIFSIIYTVIVSMFNTDLSTLDFCLAKGTYEDDDGGDDDEDEDVDDEDTS